MCYPCVCPTVTDVRVPYNGVGPYTRGERQGCQRVVYSGNVARMPECVCTGIIGSLEPGCPVKNMPAWNRSARHENNGPTRGRALHRRQICVPGVVQARGGEVTMPMRDLPVHPALIPARAFLCETACIGWMTREASEVMSWRPGPFCVRRA